MAWWNKDHMKIMNGKILQDVSILPTLITLTKSTLWEFNFRAVCKGFQVLSVNWQNTNKSQFINIECSKWQFKYKKDSFKNYAQKKGKKGLYLLPMLLMLLSVIGNYRLLSNNPIDIRYNLHTQFQSILNVESKLNDLKNCTWRKTLNASRVFTASSFTYRCAYKWYN